MGSESAHPEGGDGGISLDAHERSAGHHQSSSIGFRIRQSSWKSCTLKFEQWVLMTKRGGLNEQLKLINLTRPQGKGKTRKLFCAKGRIQWMAFQYAPSS